MRGVSAIIVIILILMIVVAMSGLAYMFFSGMLTSTTSTAEKTINKTTIGLFAQMKIESMSINDLYIRNIGQSDLTGFAVYLNDEPAQFISPNVIKSKELGNIKITSFIKGGEEIKITTSEGVVLTRTAPDPCKEAFLCLNLDEGSGSFVEDTSGHTDNDGNFSGENFNNGTFYGNTKRVDGKFGKALSFDGNGDYVDIGNSPSLNFNNVQDFSLELWVNYGGPVNWLTPLGNGAQSSTVAGYQFETDTDGSMILMICNGANRTSKGSINALNDSKWHHITGVIDRTGKLGTPQRMYLFVDGVQQGPPSDISSIGSLVTSANLNIGKVGGGGQEFNGIIDEVRIYNRSLILSEIQADMQSSTTISRTLASYSFEESGNYANDTHIWVKGKAGKALSFDGIDDYVKILNSPGLQNLDFITIEMWLKPTARNAWQTYIAKFSPFSWELYSQPTGTNTIPMFWNVKNSTGSYADVLFNLEGGNWYYLTLVFNGSSAKVYVNGNLTNSTNLPGSLAITSANITIMKNSGNYAQGIIDEVRIYNKAIY